ncbi:gamma-glutamylcyclotransferase family protein [Desulfitobacterium sp. THU1]|uniref:gamma-glutamylcyclotransferase family protein n=1 Tax=Desulfitobacterium sp. THU1 TaxID=3138072 RepID=UPI00311E5D88
MKNTFYRPVEISTEELDSIVNKLYQDLVEFSKGYTDTKHLKEYITKLINDQKNLTGNSEMGFWGLDEPEKMSNDIRVLYFYMPTYIATGILINCKLNFPQITREIPEFNECLRKGLLGCTGRYFQGHGYDNIDGLIKALHVFIIAKAHIFIEKYPNDCQKFTELFKSVLENIENSLLSGKTRGDWGEDYSLQYKCILQAVNPNAYLELDEKLSNREVVLLFVYGTLMSNNRIGRTYLEDAKFLGKGTLKGYALYDLGSYPGIVKEAGKVKGELYSVPADRLPDIDRYEGEGKLYLRKTVTVNQENGENVKAFVYIFNQSTTGKAKIDEQYQPWYPGVARILNEEKYVWYAAYGSNINRQRLMAYIMGCSDKTPPKEEMPIMLNHPIYFSNHSGRWNHKGVAFLDLDKVGKTYGKRYLITQEQLNEIQVLEGGIWYNEIVQVGEDNGTHIKTLTHTPRYSEDVFPDLTYLEVIQRGLKETYPNLSSVEIDSYLLQSYLSIEMINVLKYLRSQEHGVAISKMGRELGHVSIIIDTVHKLKEFNLIRLDGRTVREGIAWDSPNAIYYTVRDRRLAIDNVLNKNS